MSKLTQLHKRTSAAAIPRHSAAISYDFFSFNATSPIKKFLLTQTLAPDHELYIGYTSLFSAKLLTAPLPAPIAQSIAHSNGGLPHYFRVPFTLMGSFQTKRSQSTF
jgi:hypothetical protein